MIIIHYKRKAYISSQVASTAALIYFWSMECQEYLQRGDLEVTLLLALTSGRTPCSLLPVRQEAAL